MQRGPVGRVGVKDSLDKEEQGEPDEGGLGCLLPGRTASAKVPNQRGWVGGAKGH